MGYVSQCGVRFKWHSYLINSLMKAGPAGRGVCSVGRRTFAEQQLHHLSVPTVNS